MSARTVRHPLLFLGLASLGLLGFVSVGGGAVSGRSGVPVSPGAVRGEIVADTTLVVMTNDLRFVQDTVRVNVGDTVVWRNDSDLVHTVTADPDRAARKSSVRLPPGADSFHSGSVPSGAVYRHAFPVGGTYRYFCVPHEAAGMIGVVIVDG